MIEFSFFGPYILVSGVAGLVGAWLWKYNQSLYYVDHKTELVNCLHSCDFELR